MKRLDPIEDIPEETLWTCSDLAKKMNVSEQHVRNLINAGELGWCDIGREGRRSKPRVPDSEYRKYVEARTVPARLSA